MEDGGGSAGKSQAELAAASGWSYAQRSYSQGNYPSPAVEGAPGSDAVAPLGTAPLGRAHVAERLEQVEQPHLAAECIAEVDFHSLSDRDLLAYAAGIVPPSGWPAREWAVRAVDWLRREPQEFAAELGLGAADARRLVASLELARRVLERPRTELPSIRCARDAFEQCAVAFAGLEQEQFRVLALDAKHRVKQNIVVSVGSLTTSIVHPREVFRLAVRTASAAIVCVHNHPSGDPEPSSEDLEVTRRLAAVGRTLGIALLDHVVAGDNCFVSLRERISW